MDSNFIRFGVIVLIAFLYSARALACGCQKPEPPCKAFGEASVVFIGTVKRVTEGVRKQKSDGEVDFTPRLFKFSIEENFSGTPAKEAEVATGLGTDDCGYPFVKGASYLVYAYRDEKDNRLYTSSCTRTKRLASASEDLQYLRGLGSARTVTISGKVQRHLSYAENYSQGYVPMEGALVSVEAADQTKDVRTDASGNFEVTGLKPGSLKLKLQLPDELAAYRSERVLKFESGGCASEVFYVGDNGRISGRVLDAEGNPVSGLGVVILPITGWAASSWYAKTDQDGRYKAMSISAGQYMVGINVQGLARSIESAELPKDFLCPNCTIFVENLRADEQGSAYPRMFYPGVFQTVKAQRLTLSPGQELGDIDFRLPPRPAESIVKGRVLRADGTPAAGAQVSYRDVTYEDLKTLAYGVRTNAQGEFSFKAYQGGHYVVDAEDSSGDARQSLGVAEPQKVIVTKPEESITLVIKRFIK